MVMVGLLALAVLFSCLIASTIAQSAGGILITQRVTSGGTPFTIQTQIEATRMRTKIAGPNGVANVTIFDAGKEVLYIVDPAEKTYTEVTKADVARLSTQLTGGLAQMQTQIEKLPPAQRAQMEAMMKGVELTPAGQDTVGRWTCDKYDLVLAGQKIGQRCSVNLAALGFVASDFDVLLQMGAFYSVMAPQLGGQLPGPGGIDPGGSSDFPVRTVLIAPGGTVTTEVIEAGRRTFSESLFAIPAGFTNKDIAEAMGGRGTGAKR
jgi:hypothetical protein